MKKNIVILSIIAIALIAIFVESKKNEEVKRIGVIQYGDIQVWEDVKKGIVDKLAEKGFVDGKNAKLDLQNAHNDNSTMQSIAQNFTNGNYDLIISFGTAPSQAILNLEKTKPIVFAAVTDPKSAGLVNNPSKPGGNITGTSDVTLYKESLELIKRISPSVKKIGVLSNPGEPNSVFGVNETKKYAKELGLEIVVVGVNSTGEVYQAAKAIANKVDAFYGMPDNTVQAGIESLIKVSLENKKPFIALTTSDVEKGALASLGTNYIKVGEKTGDIATKVLKGENPGSIPVLGVTDADVFVNTQTAKAIGITVPEDILKSAKTTY